MAHPAYDPPRDLPSFGLPPVAEAVIGVEFEPMSGIGAVQLVRFADSLDRYPLVKELPGIPPSVGPGGEEIRNFALIAGVPPVRLWALTSDELELVQLQNDRVLHNWRAFERGGEAYPRYPVLREQHLSVWDRFVEYIARLGLPAPRPTFVEASFVNLYSQKGDGPSASGLSFVKDLPDSMPGSGSSFRFELARAVIDHSGARGRTSIIGTPQEASGVSGPKYQLNVTTKLQVPGGSGVGDWIEHLDAAHDLSVRAFGAATDEKRHDEWAREA